MGDLVYRCVIAASRAVFRGLGLRIELRGEEHLPTTGGAVLASNHLSFLDFTFLGLVGVERGRLVRFPQGLCRPPCRLGDARMGQLGVDRVPRRRDVTGDVGHRRGQPEGPICGPRYPDELWLNSAARPCLCSFHGPRLGLMTTATLVLVLVVVVALAFDFTNGFHDTGNAMATSIATGALRPKIAVGLSAVLNLVGAFLSVEVALTVTNAVINIQDSKGAPKADLMADGGYALLLIILAGLVGGIVWNVLTWLLGLPSSSSHALFGGLIGSAIAALGLSGVKWTGDGTKLDGVIGKVILPGVRLPGHRRSRGRARDVADLPGGRRTSRRSSPTRASDGARSAAPRSSRWPTAPTTPRRRWASSPSLSSRPASGPTPRRCPLWVKFSCAIAIAAGTYVGGWRVIRTLGKGLVEISPPQGMAAESASAAVILTSSHLGFALSTTHVATGSILGSGVGRRAPRSGGASPAGWSSAWLITLPAAGLVGAVMWYLGHLLGGALGPIVVVLILVALSGYMWMRSRRQPVNAGNVNDEWEAMPETKRLEHVG